MRICDRSHGLIPRSLLRKKSPELALGFIPLIRMSADYLYAQFRDFLAHKSGKTRGSVGKTPKSCMLASMFLDEAKIEVKGGLGGRGCVSWRREKYAPKGGPDGGDGGKGGNVIIEADENTDTLSNFASTKKFEADKARFGSGQNRGGKDAEDLILRVPPGTVVTEMDPEKPTEKGSHLGDLRNHGDRLLVARGGRGGFGNAHFKSSTRQRPDFAELGEPGEERFLKLDLKLVADVGIIGYPNVGKSSLISVISAARPKIANYQFTTLTPNLGVVNAHGRSYIVCDVPGLIEGASEGKGLGDKFLRHIERCGVLLHVLGLDRGFADESFSKDSLEPERLIADYRAIRKELDAYSPTLAAKRELVILNKTDLVNHEVKDLLKALKKAGISIFLSVSTATRTNVDELMSKLLPIVLEERDRREDEEQEQEDEISKELPVLRPHLISNRMGAYRMEKTLEAIQITGKRLEQFTVMIDYEKAGAIQRFRDVIERIGLERELKKVRGDSGLPVYIGKVRVDQFID